MQSTSFSWFSDEFCQISACIKFEIKKLEAYSHWILRAEYALTIEHLTRLKVIYITLARYYEQLIQIDLSQKIVKPGSVVSPRKKELGNVSKNTLMEFFKVIQEAQREMIGTNIRSDKVNFMVRMADLCQEFSELLEEYLKRYPANSTL